MIGLQMTVFTLLGLSCYIGAGYVAHTYDALIPFLIGMLPLLFMGMVFIACSKEVHKRSK
jgi:hypothetical protein